MIVTSLLDCILSRRSLSEAIKPFFPRYVFILCNRHEVEWKRHVKTKEPIIHVNNIYLFLDSCFVFCYFSFVHHCTENTVEYLKFIRTKKTKKLIKRLQCDTIHFDLRCAFCVRFFFNFIFAQ